MSETER